jgi:hypothetical protein
VPFTVIYDACVLCARLHRDRLSGLAFVRSPVRTVPSHYNEGRPHRGLDLGVPSGRAVQPGPLPAVVHRHDVLGGLVHEYEAAAA